MPEQLNQFSATEQPDPKSNNRPAVWQEVIKDVHQYYPKSPNIQSLVKDMNDRDEWGRSKYGVPLQPFNGRDALVDLYQEFLDAAVYTKQLVIEQIEMLGDSVLVNPCIHNAYADLLRNLVVIKGILNARVPISQTTL